MMSVFLPGRFMYEGTRNTPGPARQTCASPPELANLPTLGSFPFHGGNQARNVTGVADNTHGRLPGCRLAFPLSGESIGLTWEDFHRGNRHIPWRCARKHPRACYPGAALPTKPRRDNSGSQCGPISMVELTHSPW
jgi:hypothetical protein